MLNRISTAKDNKINSIFVEFSREDLSFWNFIELLEKIESILLKKILLKNSQIINFTK